MDPINNGLGSNYHNVQWALMLFSTLLGRPEIKKEKKQMFEKTVPSPHFTSNTFPPLKKKKKKRGLLAHFATAGSALTDHGGGGNLEGS